MKKSAEFRVEGLSRILSYVLGIRPDEFGLVPDEEGFVSIKELLQALHEEPELGYVRESHVKEILYGKHREEFEVDANRIRSLKRNWGFDPGTDVDNVPKILYTPVRRRAHSVVMQEGLKPAKGRFNILSPSTEMALRIGRRRDPDPVILEIKAEAGHKAGVNFSSFGGLILSGWIPSGFIAGPPLPKELLEEKNTPVRPEKMREPQRSFHAPAGSFFLDLSRDPGQERRPKGKKQKGWKEEARRLRRGKGR